MNVLLVGQALLPGLLHALLPMLFLYAAVLLFLLALLGGLMALWLAVPSVRTHLYRHTISQQQQLRDMALHDLDREMDRYLRTVVRRRPVSLRVLRKGEPYVLVDS